ncbi:hypothetical protein B296_00055936 [Ensete ventricosum]|uniref:Uncharacterized protein n=1 Tax=Ensete ventricosum TaxID=4639 RepID=A0A426X3D4_ENSVE|nr:hypothetical protein B296_00055936 [Ensete ventricosum]
MEPPPGRYADEYGPDGMPVNCWTMVRKLAVSVLSMVVGVLREALDRLRTGLLTRPSTPGCWAAAPLAGPSTVALDVIDTTIESDTHPDAAANGDGGGIRCGQPPSCAHSAWPGVFRVHYDSFLGVYYSGSLPWNFRSVKNERKQIEKLKILVCLYQLEGGDVDEQRNERDCDNCRICASNTKVRSDQVSHADVPPNKLHMLLSITSSADLSFPKPIPSMERELPPTIPGVVERGTA